MRTTLSQDWSIRTAVFVAPSIVIALMLGAIVVFDQVLRRQQTTFLEVVHGPLATATTVSTNLLLAVSEVQANVLRYAQLRQRLPNEDVVLRDLRLSISAKYDAIERSLAQLQTESPQSSEFDVVVNIEEFLTIHRAVSNRMIDAPSVDTMTVSTIMAHYQQLQSYISELAERSLASAQATADRAERLISTLSRYLILGSALIILSSIAITVYMGRAITRPITDMINVLTSIASGDRVATVPGLERGNELGDMARAVAIFNTVSQELREHERSLDDARRSAESANAAKSAFLANVSHELRTPLTSILGFSRIIQRRLDRVIKPEMAAGNPKLKATLDQVSDNFDIIVSEGARLTTLINNLLDLEKIEAGQMTWHIAALDVSDVLAQAATATASLHAAKGLSFEIDVDADIIDVQADRDKLLQVLINLISNAVKFTDQGGIRCSATMRGEDFVELGIADTGCGIAPEDQPRVFDKFRQVGDTLTEKPAGTGLGLAICKEIVEHLGGEIWLDSKAGAGSRFSFTLPVADATLDGRGMRGGNNA